jgi:hypothetical protein
LTKYIIDEEACMLVLMDAFPQQSVMETDYCANKAA